jgi:hypothetical protein
MLFAGLEESPSVRGCILGELSSLGDEGDVTGRLDRDDQYVFSSSSNQGINLQGSRQVNTSCSRRFEVPFTGSWRAKQALVALVGYDTW